MFRWRELDDGGLAGVDGDNWWHVSVSGENVRVSGNGTQDQFRKLFRMDQDWAAHRSAVIAKAPELAPMMGLLPGLRLMDSSDPVEVLFSFLCSSNNHLPRIKAMVASLALLGAPLGVVQGELFHRFPNVERIAELTESELREKGFGYRAATIPVAAKQIVEMGGSPWLKALKSVPYHRARSELLELAGVGPKLADCICLYGLGHTEAVPVDTHVWQVAARLWFPEFKNASLTTRRYAQVAEALQSRLGTLAGWAHQFLFYENLLNWRKRS